MRWLLRCYPSWWRLRYGEEFLALLEGQRATPRVVIDVLIGALDARLYLRSARCLRPEPRCSFCGKNHSAARRLIAGPNVYICDACVSLCNEILGRQPPVDPAGTSRAPRRCPKGRLSRWRRVLASRRHIAGAPL